MWLRAKKTGAAAQTRRCLFGAQTLKSFATQQILKIIVSVFRNELQCKTSAVCTWIVTDVPVPNPIMPRHPQRQISNNSHGRRCPLQFASLTRFRVRSEMSLEKRSRHNPVRLRKRAKITLVWTELAKLKHTTKTACWPSDLSPGERTRSARCTRAASATVARNQSNIDGPGTRYSVTPHRDG